MVETYSRSLVDCSDNTSQDLFLTKSESQRFSGWHFCRFVSGLGKNQLQYRRHRAEVNSQEIWRTYSWKLRIVSYCEWKSSRKKIVWVDGSCGARSWRRCGWCRGCIVKRKRGNREAEKLLLWRDRPSLRSDKLRPNSHQFFTLVHSLFWLSQMRTLVISFTVWMQSCHD